jgi:hypothetical protein
MWVVPTGEGKYTASYFKTEIISIGLEMRREGAYGLFLIVPRNMTFFPWKTSRDGFVLYRFH